jgi:hypothetical protein
MRSQLSAERKPAGLKAAAVVAVLVQRHGCRLPSLCAAASPACVRVAHVHAAVQHERLASNPHHHAAATDILASTCSMDCRWGLV